MIRVTILVHFLARKRIKKSPNDEEQIYKYRKEKLLVKRACKEERKHIVHPLNLKRKKKKSKKYM